MFYRELPDGTIVSAPTIEELNRKTAEYFN
jgi:hypothetical protein